MPLLSTNVRHSQEQISSQCLIDLVKNLPTLHETPEVPDESPVPNNSQAQPSLSPLAQPPALLPPRSCVHCLPQCFRDLLPSDPILLQQYSKADARLQTAQDEACRHRQPVLYTPPPVQLESNNPR